MIETGATESRRAIIRLGQDINRARLRQDLRLDDLAAMAGIGRGTLIRIEKGTPGVAIGAWAQVLSALGMAEHLAGVAQAAHDQRGLERMDAEIDRRRSGGRQRRR